MTKPTKPTTSKTEPETDEQIRTAVLDTIRVTDRQLAIWFSYQKPDDEALERIQRIRAACGACAQVIKNETRNGADQSAAIRKVREAAMTAIQSIVCPV